MTPILEDRLPWLDTFQLERGSHPPDGVACIMEAAAYVAGESWSDHPECVSPVIGAFLRNWNDSLDDADRQMLKPYVTRVVGTNTGKRDDETRAWLATDWLVRECAPAFLRTAGLTEHAETLEGLAAVTSAASASKAQSQIDAAWAAAGAAAGDAAWDGLQPTVKILQPSALLLLDRMIAVGKDA